MRTVVSVSESVNGNISINIIILPEELHENISCLFCLYHLSERF